MAKFFLIGRIQSPGRVVVPGRESRGKQNADVAVPDGLGHLLHLASVISSTFSVISSEGGK